MVAAGTHVAGNATPLASSPSGWLASAQARSRMRVIALCRLTGLNLEVRVASEVIVDFKYWRLLKFLASVASRGLKTS